MRILLTGATGLIGSRFEELLFENHDIIPLSSSIGVDITDKPSLEKFLSDKDFEIVIHLAGKTDVDKCEEDKEEDLGLLNSNTDRILSLDIGEIDSSLFKNKKTAVAINTIGTKNIYEASKAKGAKFIYISTDFVFSGNDEFYDEQSMPNPVDWYGMSKYLGEKVINTTSDLIVRIAFPFGYQSVVKKDLVWKLHDFLSKNDEVSLVSDQIITPTFIDDVVYGLDFLIKNETKGVINLVGATSLSPKSIGEKIKDEFRLKTIIKSSELSDVYEGKAPRPRNSVMKNDKLKNIGFTTKTFDEALALIASK